MAHGALHTPLGPLSVFSDRGAIVAIEWGWAAAAAPDALIHEATRQFTAYFAGQLRRFALPTAFSGTAFQRRLWSALLEIPYGETRSYGDIARAVGSAPRAVGQACGRNPIPVLVPCHRVVAANGSLTGYAGGGGVDTKRLLLRLEGARDIDLPQDWEAS